MNRVYKFLERGKTFFSSASARKLILGLFAVQALLLVFVTHVGIPPDEDNHLAFISFYAEQSPSPFFSEQEPTWHLGDKTREIDYIYHYIMSWIMRLLPFSQELEVYVLRIISVVVAILSFVLLAKLWQRLGVASLPINVALLVLTNLPMVLMLSSAVNNDTFVWLGVVSGVLLLLRLWQKPQLIDIIWLLNLALVGGLVKRTFLPFGLVLGILAIGIFIKKRKVVVQQVQKSNWRFWVATGLLILSIGLFIERVGGNLVTYGNVAPECNEVQGEVACKNYWSNVRREKLATEEVAPMIPLPVFVGNWFTASFVNITDIQTQGWLHRVSPPNWLAPGLMTLLIAGLVYGVAHDIGRYSRELRARWRLYVIALTGYMVLVQLIVNYSIYKDYLVFGIALNGRYILPSVLVMTGLSCFYWAKWLKPFLAKLLAISVVVMVIATTGLIMMLRNSQLVTG